MARASALSPRTAPPHQARSLPLRLVPFPFRPRTKSARTDLPSRTAPLLSRAGGARSIARDLCHLRLLHSKLEDVACAAEQTGHLRAALKRPSRVESHVAGVEEAHRLVQDDVETVGAEVAPPPARMEQPRLRDDISPFAVAALPERVEQVTAGPIPCVNEPPDLTHVRGPARPKLACYG